MADHLLARKKAKSPNIIEKKPQWTDEGEIIVKDIGENSKSLEWMHYRMGNYNKKIDKRVQYAIIITIGINTALRLYIDIFQNDKDVKLYLTIIADLFFIIQGVFTAMKLYFKYIELKEEHTKIANSCADLFMKISLELAKPKSERTNYKEFSEDVINAYRKLDEKRDMISDDIIHEYHKRITNSGIARPVIADNIDGIKIHISEENDKSPKSMRKGQYRSVPT